MPCIYVGKPYTLSFPPIHPWWKGSCTYFLCSARLIFLSHLLFLVCDSYSPIHVSKSLSDRV